MRIIRVLGRGAQEFLGFLGMFLIFVMGCLGFSVCVSGFFFYYTKHILKSVIIFIFTLSEPRKITVSSFSVSNFRRMFLAKVARFFL